MIAPSSSAQWSRRTESSVAAIGTAIGTASGATNAASDGGRPPITAAPGSDRPPAEVEAIRECLMLLAKAVRCYQTLPASHPICVAAIAAVHAALGRLPRSEPLAFRVGASWVTIDQGVTITLNGGEVDLARRLHRAQVDTVEIACSTTPAELSRFCAELGGLNEAAPPAGGVASGWSGQRGEGITMRASHRPVVIDAGTPPAVVRRLVDAAQRQRREQLANGGPVRHRYPPQRGWVRVDPSVTCDAVTLADLALLLGDPVELAVALTRLTDEEPATAIDRQTAFAERFAEMAALFASFDPQIGELLFSKLARSLLDLDESRRIALLRKTVLTGLLDGALEGSVLASFPDVALADALCLLLDLETAAPELLATAVDRLALPSERREALDPLLRDRLGRRLATDTAAYGPDAAIERFARKLIAVDPSGQRHFADYVAFDLALTDAAIEETQRLVRDTAAMDETDTHLGTLSHLLRVESDPTSAARLLAQADVLLDTLGQQGRWMTVAHWGRHLRTLAETEPPSRPEVTAAIAAAWCSFWTAERLALLARQDTHERLSPATTDALLDGFGAHLVTAIVAGLHDPVMADRARALLAGLGDHASTVAPMLAPQLTSATGEVRLAIIRFLGRAGAAYGSKVAAVLASGDDAAVREALHALATMGSSAAAITVARHLVAGPASTRPAAAEALLRFAPARLPPRVHDLLANLGFGRRHPGLAQQLLDCVGRPVPADVAPTLRALTSLRFHLWNPALVRVARSAAQLLQA
ncbi:MAG: HEAT repeat domain-containing protein [Gemmatimonas sp.]